MHVAPRRAHAASLSDALTPHAFVTPALDPRTRTAGYAMLGSAAIVLIATVSKSWFVASSEGGGLGLLGIEACRRGLCESVSWFDVPLLPAQIKLFATTALLASFATIAMLLHTGVMLLQGSPERVKVRWLAHACAVALASVSAFVISLSVGDWTHGITLGWSTVVGVLGLFTAGITTAFVVRPLTRDAAHL